MIEIVLAFVVISVLILVHELGHFLAAKITGVKVEEFGIGYPPRMWGKKIRGTLYSVNWLPFGGFVRLLGEDAKERTVKAKTSQQAFYAKSKQQKIIVILAGVVANFTLAVFLFSLVYARSGIPEEAKYIVVKEVADNSPAQTAGLKVGDRIFSLNGQPVDGLDNFSQMVDKNQGKEVLLAVVTDQEENKNIVLTPRISPPSGEGPIGVALVKTYTNVFYPWWQMPGRGAWVGLKEAVLWGRAILEGLGSSIGQLAGGTIPEVGGPVRIIQMTGDVAEQGLLVLLKFAGVLSINLAILNVLPFPALDGGRLLFLLLERFIKEEKRGRVENAINSAGMVFLVLLMVLITFNDTSVLLQNTAWWSKITSFLPF